MTNLDKIYNAKLSQKDFDKLSYFIHTFYGIKMPPEKKIMLQSRLQKRLKALDITSYEEYLEFVFSKKGKLVELVNMIDVISTNKTDFFREPEHFNILSNIILPKIIREDGNTNKKHLKVWSSACSSGQEVYTLAIILNEFALRNPLLDYHILGTDISSRVLKTALKAIYPEELINIIPLNLKKKYFLKSRNITKKTVRIVPNLRRKTDFKRLNLMDNSYQVQHNLDIIFCRNVLIYFDRETQEKIINKLSRHLRRGGYFFLGHSESIMNMNVPLAQLKPTIFRKI